ncbi:MAG: 50S ribosomal protein L29 [bacterium]|nr:50S ribosomal protein L29 [bacterium]
MRSNDVKQLQNATVEDLKKQLTDLRSKLEVATSGHVMGTLTNGRTLSSLRKDIARVLTVLRAKELI